MVYTETIMGHTSMKKKRVKAGNMGNLDFIQVYDPLVILTPFIPFEVIIVYHHPFMPL